MRNEAVPDLLGDLIAFCNSDELPPLAQAAVAHAQFETIHPFADGSGYDFNPPMRLKSSRPRSVWQRGLLASCGGAGPPMYQKPRPFDTPVCSYFVAPSM